MSAALYLMSALIAWARVLSKPGSPEEFVPKVIADRAIAWTALSVIFTRVVLVRLGIVDFSNDIADVVLFVALIAIWACGIASVRTITNPRFGDRVWSIFAIVSLVVGVAILVV